MIHNILHTTAFLSFLRMFKLGDGAAGLEKSACSFVTFPDVGSSVPSNCATLPAVYLLQLMLAFSAIINI